MSNTGTSLNHSQDFSSANSESKRVKFGFEELLNLEQAASILGMHWKTLERMARERKVPAFKVGKRWKFRLTSLNSWLEDGLKSTITNRAVIAEEEQHP
jgi:excisionase family DNA binding protein